VEAAIVNMFWHGGPLPLYAWPCIRSFVDQGHTVRLYAYGPLEMPPGVLAADARAILPSEEIGRCKSIEAFGDVFRYELLFREGGWWADVDVVCLTDRLPEARYAWAEEEPGVINGAILKFPLGEPIVAELAMKARALARHVKTWGAAGPRLLSDVLRSFEPGETAGSTSAFYPLHWLDAPQLLLPKSRSEIRRRTRDAMFLHLWASTFKDIGIDVNAAPPAGSFMHELLAGQGFKGPSTFRSRWAVQRSIRRYYRQSWVLDHWAKVFGAQPALRTPVAAMPVVTPRGWTRGARKSVPALVAQARYALRAKARSASLPPGNLDPLDRSMEVDQRFVMKSAAKWGPVFKTWWHGGYTTCLVGHSRGRRLLTDNEDRLVPKSIDLSGLFPVGWIRTMHGSVHQHHRRLMIEALSKAPVSEHAIDLRRVVEGGLSTLARQHGDVPSRRDIREALRAIASTAMLRTLFGVAPPSDAYQDLQRHYQRFGPDAPPHAVDTAQREAFAGIRSCIDGLRRDITAGSATSPCVLKHLVETKSDDDTALGNLIFLFEPAHFDVYSLWHWLLYYLARNSHVADRIAEALAADRVEADKLIVATILETLRLDQSEVLYRQAADDIVFDGQFMPKGEVVRVCLWEGHKDKASFADPFAFRPERFLEQDFGLDQFAPFGLDKRRCIGADLTMALTSIFLAEFCRRFSCALIADAPPMLGAYHWEPGADSLISVSLRP
jgi:cytochrome P450